MHIDENHSIFSQKKAKCLKHLAFHDKVMKIHLNLIKGLSKTWNTEIEKELAKDFFISMGKKIDFLSVGSSLKICLVAEGAADVYPRFGPTMEWDTGAAHAVALYSGRLVLSIDTMHTLIYNKPYLHNPGFIVQ